jgi:hypothetical protein
LNQSMRKLSIPAINVDIKLQKSDILRDILNQSI